MFFVLYLGCHNNSMKDRDSQNKTKTFTPDWFVQGVLTKLGETFDRLTGRGWNPSSSLATSKLTEKLRFLLDSEAKVLEGSGTFVPHNIKLKVQWDKFSMDSEEDLIGLKNELHTAAIDHINDRLYYTYAPINIEVKTDYFAEGVRLLASFGAFSDEEDDEAAVNVTIPNLRRDDLIQNKISVALNQVEIEQERSSFQVVFEAAGKQNSFEIDFTKKKRFSVGRAKESDLSINDKSVSKIHASLVLGSEKQLMVADTGSTNGTFIDERRIAYGKAFEIADGTRVRFGTIVVAFKRLGSLDDSAVVEQTLDDVPLPDEKQANAPPETIAASDVNELIGEIKIDGEADGSKPRQIDKSQQEPGEDRGDFSDIEHKDEIDKKPSEAEETSSELNETQDWEI